MSRINTKTYKHDAYLPDLPIVDWKSIGQSAPKIIPFDYSGPDAPLPSADIVVITWTSAEWAALDHVFVNSGSTRGPYDPTTWRDAWKLYSRNIPKSSAEGLWGYYLLVGITDKSGKDKKVLLFKSETHLSHPPYITGLTEMTKCIIEDAKPEQVYSIGTAGGPTTKTVLGDVALTNSGHIELRKSQNTGVDYNNQTFTSSFYPYVDMIPSAEKLFMPLSSVMTEDELNYLIGKLHEEKKDSAPFGYKDLVNYPLEPSNTDSPKVIEAKDTPLLTTDYYFIAKGNDSAQYSALEMDDTVIGHQAGLMGVDYCYVRNISDPVVADTAQDGTSIPDDVRNEWSSLIYETAGFYTSFNGALTTWAAISGQ
ncbi:hypothetical protein [Roseivirga sp. E12]|uniref:hypothetical protein n=1 Tax=Roseivirga sp. E12 TaxID=2819237 RepID=UPI001ABC52DE|nr:hypothetical protein [Roseivirga sp. E12]MBO3696963.1 hypothetical protein [Roseivirga sp. E12]